MVLRWWHWRKKWKIRKMRKQGYSSSQISQDTGVDAGAVYLLFASDDSVGSFGGGGGGD